MKLKNLKTYLTTPSKCYIPKCKARCCTNAPLPEDFLPKHTDKIQRNIFGGINIGQNDPHDTYNSIIYNTTTNPIQVIGIDQNGNSMVAIPPDAIERLQIKSMEEINALLASYNKYDNYCPFITQYARCSVYKDRPPICREFGTSPEPINRCHEKATPLEIFKSELAFRLEVLKSTPKYIYQDLKTLFSKLFSKNKPQNT